MAEQENRGNWVWVVISQTPEEDTLLGQVEEESGERFIPFFAEKDEGLSCLHALRKEPGRKHVVQAMHYDDLAGYARDNGFRLFNLDGEGRIVEKIRPLH